MMATEAIDKDYVMIKVPKSIGISGIRRIRDYARFLEINKNAPKKMSKKKVTALADEVTAAAWVKFKKKYNLQ